MASRALIAATLREIGRYLRVLEPSSFRGRAYEQGAVAVESAARFEELLSAGELESLPGVGASLAGVITEIDRTGESALLSRLKGRVPSGVVALAETGMSVKRAELLVTELGVSSVEELAQACREHRVRGLRGFGEKTERRLLERLEAHEASGDARVIGDVRDEPLRIAAFMESAFGPHRVSLAGAVRRADEVVDGIDIVVAAPLDEAMAHLETYPAAGRIEDGGGLRLGDGLKVRVFACDPARYGFELLSRSAAPAHFGRLVERARALGADIEAARDEHEIYARLGLPYLPAEVREGDDELSLAEGGDDFHDLLREEDVRGAVHCHTTHSDGRATILEMAKAAAALSLSYLTITDHSASAHYAGGLSTEQLLAQRAEIDAATRATGVRVLAGTESDILPDGRLDYPVETLAQLDVVIASIHARNGQDAGAMTERLVQCMGLPIRKIWGHPLGRLLLLRDPVACDLGRVLDAARNGRVVIEINGDPRRLDLPPAAAREARRRGLPFVVSSDAHSERGITMFRAAVLMARKAGLRRGHVLNTLPPDEFARAVAPG